MEQRHNGKAIVGDTAWTTRAKKSTLEIGPKQGDRIDPVYKLIE